jgi:hypothetical protein
MLGTQPRKIYFALHNFSNIIKVNKNIKKSKKLKKIK